MPRTLKNSGWKWMTAILAVAAIAPWYLRNTTAAPQPAAAAGIPDSGAQLQAVVDEVKVTNAKLESLQKLLESGKLQVTATLADKAK